MIKIRVRGRREDSYVPPNNFYPIHFNTIFFRVRISCLPAPFPDNPTYGEFTSLFEDSGYNNMLGG